MHRLDLEALGYGFVVQEHQCKIWLRYHLDGESFGRYREVFFDSWPNPRPLPVVWGLALAEAQRDLTIRRLS